MPATEADEVGIQLAQLESELDEVEKDIKLLGQFSGSRQEHDQFAESLRDQQRAFDRQIDRLLLDYEDHPDSKLRSTITDAATQLQTRASRLQRAFRSALLQYRTNAAGSAKRERELLLSGAATPAELRKRKARTGNSAALSAAADVTTALQETVSMMNEEIDKSVGNIMAMQDSSEALKKTKAEYMTMDGVLKTSKNLIQALEQADAMDRWLMLGGLVLFVAVTFNILRKRIWIPGLSTLISIVRYIFFRSNSGDLGVGEKVEAVVSPLISSVSRRLQDVPLISATLTTATVVLAAESSTYTETVVVELMYTTSVAAFESDLLSQDALYDSDQGIQVTGTAEDYKSAGEDVNAGGAMDSDNANTNETLTEEELEPLDIPSSPSTTGSLRAATVEATEDSHPESLIDDSAAIISGAIISKVISDSTKIEESEGGRIEPSIRTEEQPLSPQAKAQTQTQAQPSPETESVQDQEQDVTMPQRKNKMYTKPVEHQVHEEL
ncbi:Protein transport protein sec20 [Coemansia sp. Benny D115]|nr:Protein transport protein sec20 [Coemansia sp. Benny D115]